MIKTLALLALLLPTTADGATKPAAGAGMRFLVTTPKLTQELKVVRKSKKSVAFELKLSGTCQRSVAATARW